LFCFSAGVVSALPLYTQIWWWDLFAHGITGGAITLSMLVSGYGKVTSVLSTAIIAIGWEVVEPRLSILDLPIGFITGDWKSDILITIFGSLVCVGGWQLYVIIHR
jgi:hypothetical protein